MTDSFRNPILPGFNPDPSICFVPGQGYLLTTSTFEFFPGLPIYHSKDLQEWKLIGHAINRRAQGVDMRTVESSGGLWAPTLRYHKGRVYMICSCFWRLRVDTAGGAPQAISSGFYVSTDDIWDDARWSEAVYFDEVGFDQDLLFDDDDRVYQTVTRFDFTEAPKHGNPKIQSFINEIDLATGRSLTVPVLAKASELGVSEGCHLYKKDGWYYFFTAEGGTQGGHRECVYRSASPTGPFEPPPEGVNPLVFNHDHPDVQNTGHMDIVQRHDGRWFAVFLGVRPVFAAQTVHGALGMPTHLGRESFMAELEWVDGWPVVNARQPVGLVGHAKGFVPVPEATAWRDDFAGDSLALGWYRVRVPFRDCFSLAGGSLALRGGCDLSVAHCPSVLLQKQTQIECDWSTEVRFAPRREGEEAGTVVWLHEETFAALGLKRRGDALDIVLRWPDAAGAVQHAVVGGPVRAGEPVRLSIRARRSHYAFAYSLGADTRELEQTVPTSAFTPLFTGVHLGVYAQGADEIPCLDPAYFAYAEWTKGPVTAVTAGS